jgi:hypothetical protein
MELGRLHSSVTGTEKKLEKKRSPDQVLEEAIEFANRSFVLIFECM